MKFKKITSLILGVVFLCGAQVFAGNSHVVCVVNENGVGLPVGTQAITGQDQTVHLTRPDYEYDGILMSGKLIRVVVTERSSNIQYSALAISSGLDYLDVRVEKPNQPALIFICSVTK